VVALVVLIVTAVAHLGPSPNGDPKPAAPPPTRPATTTMPRHSGPYRYGGVCTVNSWLTDTLQPKAALFYVNGDAMGLAKLVEQVPVEHHLARDLPSDLVHLMSTTVADARKVGRSLRAAAPPVDVAAVIAASGFPDDILLVAEAAKTHCP
ncbi:MAG TPA: hypothetical protein VGM93_10730, partial [Acidimicrobiales bacterium]